MKFDLKTPCDNCPFRTDVQPYLHPRRAAEICNGVVDEGLTFSCHKTNSYEEDSEGGEDLVETDKSQHCAGALIMLTKMKKSNRPMRMAEALRIFNPRKLDLKAPVYRTANAMVKAFMKARIR